MLEVYTDGGLVGSSPSHVGGTWAYVIVRDGALACTNAGLTYALKDPIASSVTELAAVVEAYEYLARHSHGHPPESTLYTDSYWTIQWLSGVPLDGVPRGLANRMGRMLWRKVFARTNLVQIGGHPSRAELAAGVAKNGLLVSRWNVLADKLCQQAKKGF